MLIDSIDVPQEVLDAHEQGKLVIFAGAGVSMPPPSNLPSFPRLVKDLEAQFGESRDRDGESEDRFLGRLEDLDKSIRSSVRNLIGDPDSSPTDLHKHLLRLFSSADHVRIVTTNFDRHFVTAGSLLGIGDLKHYSAPALPLGNDFTGIVNLHGSVDSRDEDLVLTDRDFARAYITEGWARRFLVQMFSEFTVLFVGYSHGDIVMEYLARGLPPRTAGSKFAFVKKDDNLDAWVRRGITPVTYSLIEEATNKHQKLTDSAACWVEINLMSALDRATEVRSIIDKGLPLSCNDEDFILYANRQPAVLQVFCDRAETTEWLDWANKHNLLAPIFDTKSFDVDSEFILADWWARIFVDESQINDVVSRTAEHGGQINPVAWNCLIRRLLDSIDDLSYSSRERLVLLLLETYDPNAARLFLESLLSRLQMPEDSRIATFVFEHIFSPSPAVLQGANQYFPDHYVFKGVHQADAGFVGEIWTKLLGANIEYLATPLIPIVTSALQNVAMLHSAALGREGEMDLSTFHRSAIEEHEQDRVRNGIDVLIDTGRDIGEWLAQNHPETGRALIDLWMASGVAILKRLGTHCRGFLHDESPDMSLQWLIDQGLVYQYPYKHEVFQLLKKQYPNASQNARINFLEATGLVENGVIQDG